MDIDKINFIKKSFVNSGGKTEKLMIYRETGETDFHFVFDCPECGNHNDFTGQLNVEKRKVDGKQREVYVFNCKSCNHEYSVERLKPPRGKAK